MQKEQDIRPPNLSTPSTGDPLDSMGGHNRATGLLAILERLEAGDIQAAKKAVAHHRASYPNDPDLSTVEATVLLAEGNGQGAERTLARALLSQPDHFGALRMLGNLFLEEGRHERAARLYTRALQVADEQARAQLAPGWQRLREAGFTEPIPSTKLAFIVQDGLDQFLNDIPRELVPDYEVCKFVVRSSAEVDQALAWGDVCWFDFCNDPLVYGSHHPLAREKKIICRLHRYEAFSGYPSQVNWEGVDRLILVTGHLRHLLESLVPGLTQRTQVEVIQNGVDLEAYPFTERSPGFNIACIGYQHLRKNPMMILQIMAQLVAHDSRYKLFVAGTFQDPLVRLYWDYMIREMGLEEHLYFEGWQDDVAVWLEDKQYLLSTSIHESFGYAIAEAMARGIKPVVHNFPYAGEIWAEEMLFNTVDEAVEMITSDEYDSQLYRAFIEGHYALEKQMARIRAMLARLGQTAPAVSATTKPTLRVAGHA